MATCLYTTVRNTSGHTRVFGFLGRRGKRLAPGEQYTVRGNLIDSVARHARKFSSLSRALTNGDLAIIETPSVHLYDANHDTTKILVLSGGSLGTVDPCWGSYSSALV